MRLYAEYMRQRQKLEEDKKRSLELYQEKIEKDKQRISKVCIHLDILFNKVLKKIQSMSSIKCYYKHLRFLYKTCNIVWINCNFTFNIDCRIAQIMFFFWFWVLTHQKSWKIMLMRGRTAKQFKNYGELLYTEGLTKKENKLKLIAKKQQDDAAKELAELTLKPEIRYTSSIEILECRQDYCWHKMYTHIIK